MIYPPIAKPLAPSTADKHEAHVQPRKPRLSSDLTARAFKVVSRAVAKAAHPRKKVSGPKANPSWQRCTVKVSYTSPYVRSCPTAQYSAGKWAAHGRYLGREIATMLGEKDLGFTAKQDRVQAPALLDSWQSAGDPRLFKLMVSPENGAQADLKKFTRDLMRQVEKDLGRKLEWIAAAHRNTDLPHVHIALRGNDDLRLDKNYIRYGIRRRAAHILTRQLGYRRTLDQSRPLLIQQKTALMVGRMNHLSTADVRRATKWQQAKY